MEGIILVVLAVGQALQLATGLFVHEPSSVSFTPKSRLNNSDFGFSMAFQTADDKLVVGAPSVDFIGKVYSCEVKYALYQQKIDCYENLIQLKTVANYSRTINPNQYFYLGASISATSEYFFTCAPLWTADIMKPSRMIVSDAFGTCIMRNETDTERYQGTLERYIKRPAKILDPRAYIGGTGWSTLADEENDLLLIVKTTLEGDFTYTALSKPLEETRSVVLQRPQDAMYLKAYWNIGHGVVAGKFFSNRTVYAFSMETKKMGGVISFLEYDTPSNTLSIIVGRSGYYKLETKAIGTMFGSVLAAADLNIDGKDELIVGAPAQSDDDCVECGAVHIYLGGDMDTMEDRNRLRTILGNKMFARFGTAIAAKDLDGDSIAELVISAPYEDSGLGAVYILSGYEVYHEMINLQTYKRVQVTDLKMMQRVQKKSFRTLGYSLQFVNDVDNNGCKELAMGSPGNGSVLLFKCVQVINVTLSTELIGEQIVRETATNFTVRVCLKIDLPDLPTEIEGNITVTNSIIGEATHIDDPKFYMDISCEDCVKSTTLCENVTVILNDNESGDYSFTSKAELDTSHITSSKEFNHTWVMTSPHSTLVKTLVVPRYCNGDDCIPKLSMQTSWSGGKKYLLGSSANETVRIQVTNKGHASYEACVWVSVRGAQVGLGCSPDNGGNRCYLPKPLKRNSEYYIDLILNMTKPTNMMTGLLVNAFLHDNCNQQGMVTDINRLSVPYGYITGDLYVKGISRKRNITDKQILMSEYIYDGQEYVIINNGTITWKNIYAIISMEKKPFINAFTVLAMDFGECKQNDDKGLFSYLCTIDLMANSTQKIITSTEIIGSEIKHNLINETFNISSLCKVFLQPSDAIKSVIVMTKFKYENELSFGNNKLLITLLAVLAALIILAILTYVLYKIGFFKRKQKKRLHVLRESIKQNNSRRNTHASSARDDNSAGLQMSVVDDSPFDDPISETDDIHLVERKDH